MRPDTDIERREIIPIVDFDAAELFSDGFAFIGAENIDGLLEKCDLFGYPEARQMCEELGVSHSLQHCKLVVLNLMLPKLQKLLDDVADGKERYLT